MRWVVSLLCIFAGIGGPAHAQRSYGYFIAGPGASANGESTATLQLAGGVEGTLGKGVGIGAELGALGPMKSFSDVLGVFSANGYYHLYGGDTSRKGDPFVTGGYTMFFRSGRSNLFNLAAGVNYWLHDRIGLRLEFRDHIRTPGRGTVHFFNLRVGLIVR